MKSSSQAALITGASSGIGMELARIHAANGGQLVLAARRKERLESLKADIEARYDTTAAVIAVDLSEPDATDTVCRELTEKGIAPDILINNAGFGDHGFFHKGDWDSYHPMIGVNVTALTALTHRLLPDMVRRGNGKIMNVASMAGFLPGPLNAVYYATKAYVVSFSEALANELSGTGVTITALCPNATATEFAEVATMDGVRSFRGFVASARDVAEYGYKAMMHGKPVAVPGMANRLLVHGLLRFFPRGLVTRISRMTMEKTA